MSDGFANSILGGVGNLIRQYIQSPNYVAGTSGWIVRQDGSAEFNNVIARGSVTADALIVNDANGHPVFVANSGGTIPGNDTTDSPIIIGNTNAGSVLWPALASYIEWAMNSGSSFLMGGANRLTSQNFQISFQDSDAAPIPSRIIMDPARGLMSLGVSGSLPALPVGFGVGSGEVGEYYYEELSYPVTALANNATVPIIANVMVQSNNDYVAAYDTTTGIWTCPTDGIYLINVACGTLSAFGVAGRAVLNLFDPATGANFLRETVPTPAGQTFLKSLTCLRFFAQADQMQFTVNQNSGASVNTIAGTNDTLSFHRLI